MLLSHHIVVGLVYQKPTYDIHSQLHSLYPCTSNQLVCSNIKLSYGGTTTADESARDNASICTCTQTHMNANVQVPVMNADSRGFEQILAFSCSRAPHTCWCAKLVPFKLYAHARFRTKSNYSARVGSASARALNAMFFSHKHIRGMELVVI